MPIKGRTGERPAKPPITQEDDVPTSTHKPSSTFTKGYDSSQKEANRKSGFGKQLTFGGKFGKSKNKPVALVFHDEEPVSYYTHNLFNVGKKGYLTCAAPAACLLCDEGIQTVFQSAWRVYVINDDGSTEAKYIARGRTELAALANLAVTIQGRCSVCGGKMLKLGGIMKCQHHPKAKGSKLTDWVFSLTVTGEEKQTKWNFDRDELVSTQDGLRDRLNETEQLDIEAILAPKPRAYLEKVTADMHLNGDNTQGADDEELAPF